MTKIISILMFFSTISLSLAQEGEAAGFSWAGLVDLFVRYGLNVLGALLILLVGWWLAGFAARRVREMAIGSPRIDTSLAGIMAQMTRIAILVLTLIAVLNRFGVQTASLVAILGAAGLAIGLALQGTLSNVAAGVILLTLRPFKVGDGVNIGGTFGSVIEVSLFETKLRTYDGLAVHMPNSQVWTDKIINLSENDTRRIDLAFGLNYNDDISAAFSVIKEILEADERVLSEPEPLIAVDSLGDSVVSIIARPWASTADYYQTMLDLRRRIKERLAQEGFSFPFPQRNLHIISGDIKSQEQASKA